MSQVSGMESLIPTWVDGELKPFDKLEAHRLGLRHMAVSVFIMQGTRTLIQRRALGKYHTPGLWANACCTHPHWGEAPDICAHRRLREEVGVVGVALRRCGRVEYRANVGGGLVEHEVVTIYRGEASDDIRVIPNPAEVMEVRWVDLRELRDSVCGGAEGYTPWLRIYLREHLDMIMAN